MSQISRNGIGPWVEPSTPIGLHTMAGAKSRKFSAKTKLKHILKRIERGFEAVAPYILPIRPNRGVTAQVDVGTRTVTCYRHFPDNARLLAAWDDLAVATNGTTVYNSPLWQQGATIVPDACGRFRLMTVHQGDRLLAVAPMDRGWGGHWITAGRMTSQYHDPLVHPDNAEATWEALLRGIAKIDPKLETLTFDLISPSAPFKDFLPRVAKTAGYAGGSVPYVITTTGVKLAPTFDEYLASLKKNQRAKLRKRLRIVEESPNCKFVLAESEADITVAVPRVLAMMERTGGSKGRKTKWLYHRMMAVNAPRLARAGRVKVFQLFIDGELAAADIAYTHGQNYILWNGAFDEKFREWSPGIAVQAWMLRYGCEQGYPLADMLQGMSLCKHEMGAIEEPMHRFEFFR